MTGRPPVPDFAVAPFLVIWEITRACALACAHCRAEAIDQRHPQELSTAEGKALLGQIHRMGTPICVLTGGDPLQRDDLEELIAEGTRLGLRMATIPATTDRLTRARLTSLRDAGVAQIAFSLDAAEPAEHDAFRGVPGSFARTLEAARIVAELGVPLQINTVLGPWNQHSLFEMAELVEDLGASFWEVFVLVPVGRGETAGHLRAGMVEHLFEQIHDVAREVDFVVKVAEAPHYRRFVMMREFGEDRDAAGFRVTLARLLERPTGPQASIGHAPRSVNAGRGFCFVDHRGEVTPSGFLPISAGNVRTTPLADLYRDSDLFLALRDPDKLKGRCGRCEFSSLCGGSRSRAFALSGDPFAEDPWCAYKPGTADPALVALSQRPARPDVGHGGPTTIGHAEERSPQ